MFNFIIQVLILFSLWLIFSGHYDVMHISMGAFSSVFVTLLNYRLSKVNLYPECPDPQAGIKLTRIPTYILWLVKEIFVANLQVAYMVIHPKMPIKPSMLTFRTKLPSIISRVILGNSITLTPGTLTIDIEKDKFLVHCIIPGSAESLENGEMQSRVMKLYKNDTEGAVSEFNFLNGNSGMQEKENTDA